ncbi:hypothetical protein CR513_24231, partial [Mucuna pruriens]
MAPSLRCSVITRALEGVEHETVKYLKEFDFDLSYHPVRANVVVDALSRKSVHVSALMDKDLDIIKQLRDLSLVCEVTVKSVSVPNFRKLILKKGHRSSLSMHPSATKMYQDLKRMFWWLEMKKEVVEFVYACLWDNIFMDFMSGLPKT